MKRLTFVWLCIAATILSGCEMLKDMLSSAYTRNLALAPFDVIIVPGVPFDSAMKNTIYNARMFWAKSLFEKGITHNIIFSGSAVHSPFIEGMAMKITADTLGIPSENIFAECSAQHTLENLQYSIALAHQKGFYKIAVATDPIQSFYIEKHLRHSNIQVSLLPFSLDSMSEYYKRKIPRIDASKAYINNFIPLDKREVALK